MLTTARRTDILAMIRNRVAEVIGEELRFVFWGSRDEGLRRGGADGNAR